MRDERPLHIDPNDVVPIALIVGNKGAPSTTEAWEEIVGIAIDHFPDHGVIMGFDDEPLKDVISVDAFNGQDITADQVEELKEKIKHLYPNK